MTQPGSTAPQQGGAKTEPAPPARPAVQAVIDNATADRLYGWAWDPAAPGRRLAVALRLGAATVATATADLARPDLAGNGVGDGCHAFEFPLLPEWIERRAELAAVVLRADGTEAPVAVRIRRHDDAKLATHLQRAVESLAAEQAARGGHSRDDELLLLLTHGMLHLLGYDHVEDAEREEMFTLQDRLVSEVLGRPAPAPTVED